jgi:hypothetical protein
VAWFVLQGVAGVVCKLVAVTEAEAFRVLVAAAVCAMVSRVMTGKPAPLTASVPGQGGSIRVRAGLVTCDGTLTVWRLPSHGGPGLT